MDLTKKLANMTLMAELWVADKEKQVKTVLNEGITIEKSKIYLKHYMINVLMKTNLYEDLQSTIDGWEKRYPKVVITKGNNDVQAYDCTFKKAVNRGHITVLEFAAEKMDV